MLSVRRGVCRLGCKWIPKRTVGRRVSSGDRDVAGDLPACGVSSTRGLKEGRLTAASRRAHGAAGLLPSLWFRSTMSPAFRLSSALRWANVRPQGRPGSEAGPPVNLYAIPAGGDKGLMFKDCFSI